MRVIGRLLGVVVGLIASGVAMETIFRPVGDAALAFFETHTPNWIDFFFLLAILLDLALVIGTGVLAYFVVSRPFFLLATAIQAGDTERTRKAFAASEAALAASRRFAEEKQRQARIAQIADASVRAFESLSNHLSNAERELDLAEKLMRERAFLPFWDAVERAASSVGSFDLALEQIRRYAREYRVLAEAAPVPPPPFPVSVNAAAASAVGRGTAERLRQVNHVAQRDYEFANIFLVRSTNQVLIAGFTSITAAIDGLGPQVERSTEKLRMTIEELSASIGRQMEDTSDSARQDLHEIYEASSREFAERCDRAIHLLENLQRRHRPV